MDEPSPNKSMTPRRPESRSGSFFTWVAYPLIAVGIFSGHWRPAAVGLALLAWRLAKYAVGRWRDGRSGQRLAQREAGVPRIGLGATIAKGAIIEPGAVVEMGAEVRAGAIVRSGAVVRMGATVGKNAVIEAGAVVSWGADVHTGAVIGARAIVGAGADVHAGAQLPPGTRLAPGADFSSSGAGSSPAVTRIVAPSAPKLLRDPREQRLAAVCEKLDAELRAAPEVARTILGAPESTVAALRTTCSDLLLREQALRLESDPAALLQLDEDRAGLASRVAKATDERIRISLSGAIAAIDDQKRERGLLRLGADRLEAEHTRLLFTLESLSSLFVRLRSAGAEAKQAPLAELERGVAQLKAELAAVTDALEEVARPPASLCDYAEGPSLDGAAGARAETNDREKS